MMTAGQHNAYFAGKKAKEHDKANISSGLKHVLRAQDSKLAKEHAWEMDRNNACTKCWMIKNSNGFCPMGC